MLIVGILRKRDYCVENEVIYERNRLTRRISFSGACARAGEKTLNKDSGRPDDILRLLPHRSIGDGPYVVVIIILL